MYMSYCKYEGTLAELKVCLSDAQEHFDEEAEYPVSDSEIESFRILVGTFMDFLYDNELINEYGEFDDDRFDKICESMKTNIETYL